MEQSAISKYTDQDMISDREVLEGYNSKGPLLSSYYDKSSLISYFSSCCHPTVIRTSMEIHLSQIDLTAAKVDFQNYTIRPYGTKSVINLSDLTNTCAVGRSYNRFVTESINRLYLTLQRLLPGYSANSLTRTSILAAIKFKEVSSFIVNLSVINIAKFLNVIDNARMIFRSDNEQIIPAEKELLATASWKTFRQILRFLVQEIERSCPNIDAAAVVLNRHERRTIMRLVYHHFSLVYRLFENKEGLEQRLEEARMLLMEDLQTMVTSRMNFECVNLTTPYLVVFILVVTYTALHFSFNVADT
ncbi:uncharacterized protein LOC108669290 [Hyalella azteca]|uniref:Uncharacterized protein LOC108669290 n=1 Tax=Hyalella azteca TaxID=294128 RepID=A0A8B7NF64_HYAAZ|nr:uncharacterized protein LOC108669290 [Hyalella azteca]